MAEQILHIENVDPKDLYGPNNKYLDKVKALFPKLKIIARGDFVKVMGDEEEMEYFFSRFEMLTLQLERKGKIDDRDIDDVMKANSDLELQQKMSESDVLVFGRGGMPVKAITANQKRMVSASEHKDLIFAIGPAGTGKTYTAVALAVRALKARQVRRIILTRPAVEAGENLGFLPGDLKEKIDPYLRPLYDALYEMLPADLVDKKIEMGEIEIAPLAFMRGRTLNNAMVILDEAQNTTPMQMKMFLTRLGENSRMVINGDLSQTDLPRGVTSGLTDTLEIVSKIDKIGIVHFSEHDVVRHGLVAQIVKAYDQRQATRKGITVKMV